MFSGGEPLGVENGAIADNCLTASTFSGHAPPHLARLNGPSAWCAGKATDCYLQVRICKNIVFSLPHMSLSENLTNLGKILVFSCERFKKIFRPYRDWNLWRQKMYMFLRAKYHRFVICVNLNKLEELLTIEWFSRRRAQFLLHHLTSKIQLIMEQENIKFICN